MSQGVHGETVEGGLDDPAELEPDQGDLDLVGPDDRHTRADWEAAAAAVLRKARRLGDDDAHDLVWDRLTRTTLDGIGVTPLGVPDDLQGLTTGGRPTRTGSWDVRVRNGGDNRQALADLENGATSIWLQADEGSLESALAGVLLDVAPVILQGATLARAESFTRLGALHPDANLGATADADMVPFARLARQAGIRAAVVDGTTVHERGASDGQELGWVLARGTQMLRSLEAAGLRDPFGLLELRIAATDEQLLTIAKFRALRRLWARVAEVSGGQDPATRIHGVTSRPMTSRYDVHVNIVRGVIAAFAAGVGGADAVTVVPFDEPTGAVSELGRRIARNTSALLVEESHVAAVADPAGGSFAVERLTSDLCEVAWAELGRTDSAGSAGFEDRVAEVARRRADHVAHRVRPVTGLSEFANPADPVPDRRNRSMRYGAAFEALRDDPPTGRVFLATLGTVADHSPRAGFATNLLAAGGVPVDVAGATRDAAELGSAYAGQPVVCLAGTDAAYDAWGADAVAALREAGASWVVVAGKPREWADDSCALGLDAVDFLGRTREKLS